MAKNFPAPGLNASNAAAFKKVSDIFGKSSEATSKPLLSKELKKFLTGRMQRAVGAPDRKWFMLSSTKPLLDEGPAINQAWYLWHTEELIHEKMMWK